MENIKKTHKKKNVLSKIFHNTFLVFIGIGLFVLGALLIWLTTIKIPDFSSFENRSILRSTKIYDRTGKVLLYDLHKDIKRTEVKLSEMNPWIQKATIAIEDDQFYKHSGIRVKSIIRAVFLNITTGDNQGGSTLTQQIVKNTLLTKEKTITRKIKEWIIAIKIERNMTKDQILEIYLNDGPYGGNIYGAEEASQSYFGKKAIDLTLAESAYLAAIPKAPTYYSPFGSHKDKLEERKNIVLNRMFELKIISKEELDQAKKEIVVWSKVESHGIKAPHFVFYIKEYLENTLGKDAIEQGGYKITTTLDYEMQKEAEEIVLRKALENSKVNKAENASLVAIDPKTGQILTMVGSRDYFDKEIDGAYNTTTANRQPGSAFKPIIYALSFEKGYRPDTVLFDLKTEFNPSCNYDGSQTESVNGPCYSPTNYTGNFSGPLTVRKALAGSINIPAVKMLYLVGIQNAITFSREMGLSTLTDPTRYGLSLVLGGGEVKLIEMTSLYGIFATNGIKHNTTGILKIENEKGETIEEYKETEGSRVLSEKSASWISDILSDNDARTWIFGANSSLYIKEQPVAVKTGTTSNYRDAWIVGYTPSLVVGAWVGNNNNTPMAPKASSILAAPIWKEFFTKQLHKYPVESFPTPEEEDILTIKPILRGKYLGGESTLVDKTTGQPANENTIPENIVESIRGGVHSILYWIDKENPRGPKPTNPYNDPQFSNWEKSVRDWTILNGKEYSQTTTTTSEQIPKNESNIILNITQPKPYEVHNQTDPITVNISSVSETTLKKWDIFLNNTLVGTQTSGTNFIFTPNKTTGLRTNSVLTVVVYDKDNNTKESSVPITFSF